MNPLLADPRTEQVKNAYESAHEAAQAKWRAFEERKRELEGQGTDLTKDGGAFAELRRLHSEYERAADAAAEARETYIKALENGGGKALAPSDGRLTSITDALLKAVPGGGIDGFKALVSGSTIVPSFFDEAIRGMPRRSLFIQSVMPTVQTDSPIIEYVRQTTFTNAAAPVAEGAEKPKSTITVERVSETARVVATVSEAIDRALLVDYDGLRRFLDEQLRSAVLLAVEQQVISGSGVAPNLRGVLNTVGIGSVARGTDSHLDALHKAITTCRLAFFEPDAIVLHPRDYEDVRLSKDADGNYTTAPATDEGPPRLLGKEVITSPVMAEGTALVGAFGIGATLYQREGVLIEFATAGLGDSAGQEMFSRNLVRFRAEGRWALAIPYPAAFCQVTGL